MPLMGLFSRKKAPPPDTYQYSFSDNVRSRILQAFKHLADNSRPLPGSFEALLDDVEDKLAREYGGLHQPAYRATRRSDSAIINHFFCCPDALVIDFILTAFRSRYYTARQQGVEEINRILREEAIGYEFTNYNEREVEKPDNVTPWRRGQLAKLIETDYPEAIEKREEYPHDAIVRPCLSVLANPIFGIANAEMLKAHEHIRKGNLDDALTCCGAAYESLIKTILDRKKWAFDPAKDTCATLVDICVRNGLIPGFYADALKAPGRIRNNLSSAHGRGPTPAHTASQEHVEHMIQLTSANILLLVKLAKL